MYDWGIEKYGGKVHIDDYDNMPTDTIMALDVETNGVEINEPGFKIVCIGLSNGRDAWVYFHVSPVLLEYLRLVRIIGHDLKRAEIPWLEQYGVTIKQAYFDTKTGVYLYNQARKKFGLKDSLKELFGVEYPTYKEIITNEDFIREACKEHPELIIKKPRKPTKKNPSPYTEKVPKVVTLDKMPKELVASYNACDTFHTYRLWQWLRKNFSTQQRRFFDRVEMPMTRYIYEMERKGTKIDLKEVRRIHNEESKARRKAAKECINSLGKINLNSPKQLLPALRKLGVQTDSTDESDLVSCKDHPAVQALLTYRGHQKICSTYTIPLYFNAVKDSGNRIHTRFTQSTITGRLASSEPINLQNQPPATRGCFVGEDGYKLIDADWSNIELRLPAHFSREPKFLEELSKPDGDLHSVSAALIFGGGVASLPEGEFKKRRRIAKTCNFLLTNSGTAWGLSQQLECPIEEAEEIYTKFWEGYPTLRRWLDWEKNKARNLGGIGTLFGRWVKIPQLRLQCEQPGKCGIRAQGRWFRRCKNCGVRESAEKTAMSVRVQGSASDMMKMAALKLQARDYVGVLTVHDELLFEEKEADVPKAVQDVKDVMEHITTLRVPLVCEPGVGRTWKEAHL